MTERRQPNPRIDEIIATLAEHGRAIAHAHDCTEDLKREVQKNTEVTEQVRDILASFRVMGSVAKWIGGIAGALAGVWAFMKGIRP